jgi:hypothetical protein
MLPSFLVHLPRFCIETGTDRNETRQSTAILWVWPFSMAKQRAVSHQPLI